MECKFIFYWLSGEKEELIGETPEQALNNAGYGQGALKALDFYSTVQNQDYRWENNKWELYKICPWCNKINKGFRCSYCSRMK